MVCTYMGGHGLLVRFSQLCFAAQGDWKNRDKQDNSRASGCVLIVQSESDLHFTCREFCFWLFSMILFTAVVVEFEFSIWQTSCWWVQWNQFGLGYFPLEEKLLEPTKCSFVFLTVCLC